MTVEFVETDGSYVGTADGGRRWTITPNRSGWRLEFTDPGDSERTNAGQHGSVRAAKNEANR